MATTRAALAEFTAEFLAGVERRGQRYDCTQPEIYAQFTSDVVAAMAKRHSITVAPHDVELAVRDTPALRDHAMLRRRVDYDTVHLTHERRAPDVTLLDAVRTHVTSLFAPPAAPADPVAEAAARTDATRCLAEVRAAIERALTEGSYLATSSTADGDWYALVSIRYAATSAGAVETALATAYSRAEATRHRHRPYLSDMTRFNVHESLRLAPKHALCAALYLCFPYDPAATAL